MATPSTRTMHELLRDLSRAIGDPDATSEELEALAIAIRRRATQTAHDITAIAESRRRPRGRRGLRASA